MKVLQIHSEYSSSKISGENSTVKKLHEIFSNFAQSDIYNPSTELLHSSRTRRLAASRRYLFNDSQIVGLALNYDIVLIHNPIPLISTKSLRSISKSSPVVRIWHNFRNSCVSGNHFRDGNPCFDCVSGGLGKLPGIRHACYRDSVMQSAIVSFAESELSKLYSEDRIWHVGISQFMCDYIESQGIHKQKVRFIPNAVQGMKFSEIAEGNDLLMMGRVEVENGFERVVRAWSSIPADLKAGRTLHLVGDGKDFESLQALAHEQDIQMHGVLTPTEISFLAAKCEIGIASSLWEEPFGKIAAEYQSLGLRTLVTPRGGLPEISRNGVGGIVATDITVESIKMAIFQMLKASPVSRLEIFQQFESSYSIDSISELWWNLFEEILNA